MRKSSWQFLGSFPSLRDPTIFLLDESLVPSVARALSLVGYSVHTVDDVLGRRGVKDPEIINWCGENEAVWIHADDNARREHARLINSAKISTVWVPRPKKGLSAKQQLSRLAYKMQAIESRVAGSKRPVHLKLSASGTVDEPRVSLTDVSADQIGRG